MTTQLDSERKAWPDPPRYWVHYSDENIKLHVSKGADGEPTQSDSGAMEDTAGSLPHGVFLDPPREPQDGFWKAFGFGYDVIDKPHQPLALGGGEMQSVASTLKRLSHSLLLSYLDLLDAAATNPGEPPPDAKAVEFQPWHLEGTEGKNVHAHLAVAPMVAFAALHENLSNLHQLLNAHRPHLARATLRAALRRQLDERKKAQENTVGILQKARKDMSDVWNGLDKWRVQEEERTRRIISGARPSDAMETDGMGVGGRDLSGSEGNALKGKGKEHLDEKVRVKMDIG
ncbi:hypothetical protein M427DRAFT_50428 [Gonapodya prolifera JEL478]|uniref:Mediator of RNA polymerase II transcription subunit 7 n=1 Tax=Gonapodya prolifera (strain JEL478) TaxID=1344416 RepID=A0A139AZA7_GONPJ|nr:hypothetical protein M427DRAFT_50428 [Gonapodya prolifera JEL478]|eukprot:KXS22066.1 hypothetical protein M427DRAFT_50428 [Gonapodya prolifera JEL478]